jgi:hypothetical protein
LSVDKYFPGKSISLGPPNSQRILKFPKKIENPRKKNGGGGEFKYYIFQYIVRTFENATLYCHSAQQ